MSDNLQNGQVYSHNETISIDYILSRIDKIINDTSYIHEAITAVRDMAVNEGMNNQDGDKARGNAIKDVVLSRETTNQQLIRLFEKMYDDLKPAKEDNAVLRFSELTQRLSGANFLQDEYSPEALSIIRSAAQGLMTN